ncbi:uncharacterized protein N0V89_001252 [Didymosphaeria variabile]|uniref:Uncharacterized protein n=1 Tax=Didymosphaeria variabile TaxID=1932322 RepID=A0A9W8XXR9_9PLEO|nr:uncharacterized protein N0V89_001252 [Didymosphaeria variabile]KAJ4360685.1 hypothetical protein N0V89_001252 [Didymosphaeria variabile]
MVYDIGDPSDPTKPDWYQLKRHDKRWTEDIDPERGDRCYDAEHVLEWSLLLQFLGENNSRCALLWKYFSEENMPKNDITVRKAKDYKKTLKKGDHFDYTDAQFKMGKFKSFWSNDKDPIKEPRPIDWIGMQWPGQEGSRSRPPTPWEYELILLNKEFNIKKNNVWDDEEILPVPDYEPGTTNLKKTQANSNTLEALYGNRYFEEQAEKKWQDNRGKCKAIYKFTTLMSLVSYHNDPYIQEVMRAQVRRVGRAFEHLEKTVLPALNEPYIDPVTQVSHPYKRVNLRATWFKWIKKVHKARLGKLNAVMEEKVKVFEADTAATTRFKRWDFFGVFRRAVKEPNCGFEPDDQKILERVELMLDAYGKLEKVDTELTLEGDDEDKEDDEEEQEEGEQENEEQEENQDQEQEDQEPEQAD